MGINMPRCDGCEVEHQGFCKIMDSWLDERKKKWIRSKD